MRAGHHAILWLSILHEAVSELIHHSATDHPPLNMQPAFVANITSQLNANKTPLPRPKHATEFVDAIQCFTDLEPRNNRSTSLSQHVIATTLVHNISNPSHWSEGVIIKGLFDSHALEEDRKKGHYDQVVVLVGGASAGPIHFSFEARSLGKVQWVNLSN